ncbi:GntR family transcriptional regulator [Botryobacter ruber]|uniref:GntR family transcriptional regulator n=1 Tax=Botryobacter ruber TaxID=2171629 RepID=UPI000E0A0DF2|nr:GntR family transcriptional regulator [Botryobacter ruber]
MEILDRINATSATPVYLQVADAILSGIETGTLKRDRQLPSINELSENNYLSRDTVEKAYQVLRKRGVIVSVKAKGCYVSDTFTSSTYKVLLLLNKVSAYKKAVYYSLLKALGDNAVVDLHIHHFDGKICESLLQEHLAKYQYVAIMPHFNKNIESAKQAIRKIPKEKLLLLDKSLEGFEGKCAAVYQDFERDIRKALHSGKDLLSKYERLTLVHPEHIPYPIEIVKGFRHFCCENSIEHSVTGAIRPDMDFQGTAFVVLDESDLVELIELGRAKGLVTGKDYGIVSYNDTPLKEVLENGITVISTDHEKMGETAAHMIKNKLKEQVSNPFTLIRRNSL